MFRKLVNLASRIPAAHKESMKARDGLDVLLKKYLPRRGFFIEAGGYDGVTASNSYYLELNRGWDGILIEPDPEKYSECLVNRPNCKVLNTALVPLGFNNEQIELTVLNQDRSMSFVNGAKVCDKANSFKREDSKTVKVSASTLSQVLDGHQISEVDFLSLDVEGYEASVLQGVDFARHTLKAILVECLSKEAERAVIDSLPSSYKKVAQLTPRDSLFMPK